MPRHITAPTRIEAQGNKPKLIDEYIGQVNTGGGQVSIAHMRSPGGWVEPGQRPDFTEHTIVLKGMPSGFADLAEQVFGRNERVFEDQLRGRRAANTQFVLFGTG